MPEKNALFVQRHNLLRRQVLRRIRRLVIAVDGNHRSDGAKLIEYPQLTDVTSMENQVDAGKYFRQRFWNSVPALRHVGI